MSGKKRVGLTPRTIGDASELPPPLTSADVQAYLTKKPSSGETQPIVSGKQKKAQRGEPVKSTLFFALGFAVVVVFLLLCTILFRFAFVYLRLVFIDPPLLTKAAIPYYSRPGVDISDRSVTFLQFEYFVIATDMLDAIHLVYVPSAIALGLLCRYRSLETFGYSLIVTVVFLLHLAKVIYFGLYATGILSCDTFFLCVNRSSAAAANTPDTLFWAEFITMIVVLLLDIALFYVARVYRASWSSAKDYS